MRCKNAIGIAIGAGLIGMAIGTELAKPAAERTWTGKIGGALPYDLRFPTPERVRSRLWNPDDPQIVQPQAFGVGWTINAGRLARLAGIV
ncbi:MAG: DUF5808 domain-containing protein [Candidatus Dormiibacterota bacterium]